MQNYEMRWYVTFYDERDQQLDRVQVGLGKIAIPLDAMYMTFVSELKPGSGGGI